MRRIFEYDDYPRGRARFLRLVDSLVETYPNFKCNVFAIPNEMDRKSYREIARRPFLRLNPHGMDHNKGECRLRLGRRNVRLLRDIAKDERWSHVFKAPWHGMSPEFIELLYSLGMIPAIKTMQNIPYPVPVEWTCYCAMMLDSKARLTDDGWDIGRYVESHPVYNRVRYPFMTKAWTTEISRQNLRKWMGGWHPDDTWDFVEDFVAPVCVKLHLGCGEHVWDGWINLDPRTHLDERIIDWDFNRQIPVPECRADVVFTSHVFNYVEEDKYDEALLEIWRVLRPGAILRMAEDCTDSGYVWRRPGESARGTGEIKSLPTKAKIVDSLKRVGFQVYDAQPGSTLSPHKDVLCGDSRERRYRQGHKFYVEAIKHIYIPRLGWVRRRDPRATLHGRYKMPS